MHIPDATREAIELRVGLVDLRLRGRPLGIKLAHGRADRVDAVVELVQLLLRLLLLLVEGLEAVLRAGPGRDREREQARQRDEHRVVETQDVTLRPATEQLGSDKFRISDITWDEKRNRFVAISSQERGIIELDRDGRILYAARLPRGEHRQAEGIAIDGDGKLLIADEGGKARARLTTYPARHP